MKLNRYGKLAMFWEATGDTSLPYDFCTFFWGLVGRVIKCLFGMLLLLIFAAMAVYVIFKTGQVAWGHKLIALGVMAAATVLILAIRRRELLNKFEVVNEVADVIGTKAHSVKNRFCPRIEWSEGKVTDGE